MEITIFFFFWGGVPNPQNLLTKMWRGSAMTPRMPKLKTNAPLGTWRRMRELSPSRGF